MFALLPLEKHNVDRWELVVSQKLPLLISVSIFILINVIIIMTTFWMETPSSESSSSSSSSSSFSSGRTQWSTWMVQDLFHLSLWPVTRVAGASLQQSGRKQYQNNNGEDDGRAKHYYLSRHDNEEMTKVDGFQEPGSFRQVNVIVMVNSFFFLSFYIIHQALSPS